LPLLLVRVKPKSSRSALLECREGVWQISLSSPPEDGKANRELIRLLAKALAVPPTSLQIAAGEKSRNKKVLVPDLADEEVRKRLEASLRCST
jgi:uncharacterized protein (TIGR00251 family)